MFIPSLWVIYYFKEGNKIWNNSIKGSPRFFFTRKVLWPWVIYSSSKLQEITGTRLNIINYRIFMNLLIMRLGESFFFFQDVLLVSCSDHVPLVRPGSFHFTLLWLTEKRKIWGRRFGGKRGSNNHHPAASRHDASAGASINTHRKCFPRRPLWANQSRTPLVQSSLSVSHPSDYPAPSRLQFNCLALQPAHTHTHHGLPLLGDGGKTGQSFIFLYCLCFASPGQTYLRSVFPPNWLFVTVIDTLWTSCADTFLGKHLLQVKHFRRV